MKERERKRKCERIRECRSASVHARVCGTFFFWIAADMELAEQDRIVRIRRREFTKRRLPMCNSFWRPWNCYCEKFCSCYSSTQSPQIGTIQPPLQPPTTPTTTTPTFLWSMHESRWGCDAMVWFFCEFCSSQKFLPLWGMDETSHSLMPLALILWKCVKGLVHPNHWKHIFPLPATQIVLVSPAEVFRYLRLRLQLPTFLMKVNGLKKILCSQH